MPPVRLDSILGTALSICRRDLRSDAELLTRFLDNRDEIAFTALLVRHAPAVRVACRGWLRSQADIDDAAQATFLVLVQRARSIRDRDAVGRWLYGVATNVARRLRQQRPTTCSVSAEVPAPAPTTDDDLRDLLAEEIARLPEKYRLPVQLCYSTGLTTAEAARRLGWPKGTVLTRLAWARQRLQTNLTRRGVAPAVLAGLAAPLAQPVQAQWVCATARAAQGLLAGEAPARIGVSARVILVAEGVVRTMMWNNLKYGALAVLMTVGVVGFGVGQWSALAARSGDDRQPLADAAAPPLAAQPPSRTIPSGKDAAKADEPRPGTVGRRREAVIRLPAGAYVKEVDAAPYGSGRLTWIYEDERILGQIEASVMGGEIELATEAEYALSSTGTIYGLITSVRLNHLRLPNGEEFAQLKPFVGLWPAVEPLVNDMLTDLPFSYQFRVQGERLVINNFRILLAGPNPLGKLGGVAVHDNGVGVVLAAFQGLGTALEGSYMATDAKERAAPNNRPLFQRPGGRGGAKSIR